MILNSRSLQDLRLIHPRSASRFLDHHFSPVLQQYHGLIRESFLQFLLFSHPYLEESVGIRNFRLATVALLGNKEFSIRRPWKCRFWGHKEFPFADCGLSSFHAAMLETPTWQLSTFIIELGIIGDLPV